MPFKKDEPQKNKALNLRGLDPAIVRKVKVAAMSEGQKLGEWAQRAFELRFEREAAESEQEKEAVPV